uniref:Uncharacterized protein n=1 Tax=Oryza meridionalis TaxID=40149 RepID=A0A0E0EFS6_9ORYZ
MAWTTASLGAGHLLPVAELARCIRQLLRTPAVDCLPHTRAPQRPPPLPLHSPTGFAVFLSSLLYLRALAVVYAWFSNYASAVSASPPLASSPPQPPPPMAVAPEVPSIPQASPQALQGNGGSRFPTAWCPRRHLPRGRTPSAAPKLSDRDSLVVKSNLLCPLAVDAAVAVVDLSHPDLLDLQGRGDEADLKLASSDSGSLPWWRARLRPGHLGRRIGWAWQFVGEVRDIEGGG